MATATDKTQIAYRAGLGARSIGRSVHTNPYPFETVCAEHREAWDRGWFEQDTEIAFRKASAS